MMSLWTLDLFTAASWSSGKRCFRWNHKKHMTDFIVTLKTLKICLLFWMTLNPLYLILFLYMLIFSFGPLWFDSIFFYLILFLQSIWSKYCPFIFFIFHLIPIFNLIRSFRMILYFSFDLILVLWCPLLPLKFQLHIKSSWFFSSLIILTYFYLKSSTFHLKILTNLNFLIFYFISLYNFDLFFIIWTFCSSYFWLY